MRATLLPTHSLIHHRFHFFQHSERGINADYLFVTEFEEHMGESCHRYQL